MVATSVGSLVARKACVKLNENCGLDGRDSGSARFYDDLLSLL